MANEKLKAEPGSFRVFLAQKFNAGRMRQFWIKFALVLPSY